MNIPKTRTIKFILRDGTSVYIRVYYTRVFDDCDIDVNLTRIIKGLGRRKKLTKTDPETLAIVKCLDFAEANKLPESCIVTLDNYGKLTYEALEFRRITVLTGTPKSRKETHVDAFYRMVNPSFFTDPEPDPDSFIVDVDEFCSYDRGSNKRLTVEMIESVTLGLQLMHPKTNVEDHLQFNLIANEYKVLESANIPEAIGKKEILQRAREYIQSRDLTVSEQDVLHGAFNSRVDLALAADIYDTVNRFVATNPEQQARQTPIKTRPFKIKNREYKITLTSAQLERKDGEPYRRFAGVAEQKVETALRRLFSRKGSVSYGALYGLNFSLYEVQQELLTMSQRKNKSGRVYSYEEIKHSIEVLHKSGVSIENTSKVSIDSIFDGSSSTYLPNLMWSAFGDRHFCTFHAMLMSSVSQLEFRAYNPLAENTVSRGTPNSDAIKKVLYLNWTNASSTSPYKTTMNALLNLAGIASNDYRTNRQKLIRALDSLSGANKAAGTGKNAVPPILDSYSASEQILEYDVSTGRKKPVDLKVVLQPSETFVSEVIHISTMKNEQIILLAQQMQDSDKDVYFSPLDE